MIRTGLAAIVALIYVANGGYMVIDPSGWYATVPGVTATGPMNAHFIPDIGFIYILSGLAFALAVCRPRAFRLWVSAGTAWPALHGVFHIFEWLTHGPPPASIWVAEALAVVFPVMIGIVLALTPSQRELAPPA